VEAVNNNAGAAAPTVNKATIANCSDPEKIRSDDAMVNGTPRIGRAAAP